MAAKRFGVGLIYEDCAYHPVLCTEEYQDGSLGGISLLDGSYPRNCDPKACGPEPLTIEQAMLIKRHHEDYMSGRQQGASVDEALRPFS